MLNKSLLLALFLCVSAFLKAAPPEDSTAVLGYLKQMDSVNKALKYETGKIELPGGKVSLNVPAGFKYLNAEQSKYVLTEVWGNPPSNAVGVLGMIFPEKNGPFSDSSFAFVISFEELGYVKDDDAADINYDDLLKTMQKEEVDENKERVKNGYEAIHMVGWAQKPFYDKDKKILHWAKELKFGDGADGNTLNYEIRLLGRKGVLSLNAVSSMNELPLVKNDISKVLDIASFSEGNTYADFDPDVDEVAAWTIGGLVAGKVLLKAGFFAVILKFLAASWKFILIGLMAFAGVIKKFFSRKKQNAEEDITAGYEVAETPDAANAQETIPVDSNTTPADTDASAPSVPDAPASDNPDKPAEDATTQH